MSDDINLQAVRNGERKDLWGANLVNANLRDAYLWGANLGDADLRDANLGDADLWDSNLQDANLLDANLQDANLRGANLLDANLQDANLRGANLKHADLWDADLKDANLKDANLKHADLWDADLKDADLKDANLKDANLKDANLKDANLKDANLRGADIPVYERLPQEGSFIAYKYTREHLLQLEIPADAERTSCLTSAKCRSERARVSGILSSDGSECNADTAKSYYRDYTYHEGEMAEADGWDPDARVACTHGIHFYPSKRLAQRNAPWNVSDNGGGDDD
jgi:uncharacterized protein YjbI with pentapeptide repeats